MTERPVQIMSNNVEDLVDWAKKTLTKHSDCVLARVQTYEMREVVLDSYTLADFGGKK